MRGGSSVRREIHVWDAERQQRLIELFRLQYTLEEIARELGFPLDMVKERIEMLELESDIPEAYM